MNFKDSTNEDMRMKTKLLVERERGITLQVLHHLKEIESRKIYLAWGYSSLFVYCREELGYSEGSACRRIEAMRLIRDLPEVEAKIESGAINLSTAIEVQKYFRAEPNKHSRDQKLELITHLQNKSTNEVRRELITLSPELERKEHIREISETKTELRIVMDDTLKSQLDELKQLLSHKNPHMSYLELISELAEFRLKKLKPKSIVSLSLNKEANFGKTMEIETEEIESEDPESEDPESEGTEYEIVVSKTNRLQNRESKSFGSPNKETKNETVSPISGAVEITAAVAERKRKPLRILVKRKLLEEAEYQCQWFDPKTGYRCKSKHLLQIDHITPIAYGGGNEESNLRVLCAQHNQYRNRVVRTRKPLSTLMNEYS